LTYDASKILAIAATLPSPFSRFAVEPLSSLVCKDVILCAPAILGCFPFVSDQSRSLQPLKGDKQGACIEAKNAQAHLFEPDCDSISVHGFERKRFQNEQCPECLERDRLACPVQTHSP
jgi:hypothetical protein